ncbi:MAG TPA: response regulator [Rhodobacteraceae bacterium]|nr:response regulator [Paracoccaceae bacterium]
MDDSDPFAAPHRIPTPARPLLGMTVLVVEDSRFACEAMRLLCLRSGARIRRADCLASARRHLGVYRPTAMVIDLGLPDGSGLDLIEEMARATPRVDVLLATSGDDFAEDAAIAAGADGFLAKPIHALAVFQQAILSRLPPDRRPGSVRLVPEERVAPDPVAYRDDMAHVADVLTGCSDGKTLDYVAQFLRGVAVSAEDGPLARAAEALAQARADGRPAVHDAARVAGLVQSRLDRRQAI